MQGRDEADLVGRARHTDTPRDLAAEFTIGAEFAGDQDRLAELAALGAALVARAEQLADEFADDDQETERFVTMVRGWAAGSTPQNYLVEPNGPGRMTVHFEHPDLHTDQVQSDVRDLDRVNQAMRLQNTYGYSVDRTAPTDSLLADITVARSFGDTPPHAGLNPLDSIAAVAATAVVAHVRGRLKIAAEDLRWATTVLIRAITQPGRVDYVGSSFYSPGADRSAAVGLPLLLAVDSPDIPLDRQAITEVLDRCADHHFDEVRIAFAAATAAVWAAPCDSAPPERVCRHEVLLQAVRSGLRGCRLGEWEKEIGRRARPVLEGPYEQTLAEVATERLDLTRLIPPLIATAAAARGTCCIAGQASGLVEALFDAHLRAADHWAREDFDNRHSAHSARVIVETAIDSSDADIDATLARARPTWLHPDSIADLVIRWIPVARREPRALDALAQLSGCAPLAWQRETGLRWAEQLPDDTPQHLGPPVLVPHRLAQGHPLTRGPAARPGPALAPLGGRPGRRGRPASGGPAAPRRIAACGCPVDAR